MIGHDRCWHKGNDTLLGAERLSYRAHEANSTAAESNETRTGDCVKRLAQLPSSMQTEVENQVAAPAETRTPNWHRAN
jgi:hypothetical protein